MATVIRVRLSAILAISLVAGCIHAEDEVVRRASIEADCPASEVRATERPELSDATYDVAACGHVFRYTCSRPNGYPLTCAREPDPTEGTP